jgi:antirestriction protein ArdC
MDTYAIVTEKIINLLERGIVPFAGRGAQMDCRATSYRKNHTGASILSSFRRPNTSRPCG